MYLQYFLGIFSMWSNTDSMGGQVRTYDCSVSEC